MLVLSRKPGSSIVINSDIYITVLEVQGQRVRLGIDAPSNMSVHRHEIQQKIDNEKHLFSTGKTHQEH